MSAYPIRYRLDGPGPAAFLVECDGEYRIYARGELGGTIPQPQLRGMLATQGCRWVAATGEVTLKDADAGASLSRGLVGAAAGADLMAPV